VPRLTDDQREERRSGLGASDIAVAAGVSPWQTPFELYLEKIGELDPELRQSDRARESMERGHRLERVALEWDRDITGDGFELVRRTVWHPVLKFLYCHPDARRKPWSTTRRLIEVKTSNRPWKVVPRYVEMQVMAQMAVTGARAVDVLVMTFDGPPVRHVVDRDDQLVLAIEGLAVAFWDRVQRRDPPPIDGSSGAGRWLDRTRWRDEPELVADEHQARALKRLLDLRAQVTALEAEDDTIVNALKFSMAGSSRLSARGIAKVLWTAPFDKTTTSWKEVAAGYRKMLERVATDHQVDILDELEAVESLYTRVTEGNRQFRVITTEEHEA